jgi:hypothetical protein
MDSKYLILVSVQLKTTAQKLVTALQSAYDNGAAGFFRVVEGHNDMFTIAFQRDSSEDHEYVAKKILEHGISASIAAMWQLSEELAEELDGESESNSYLEAIINLLRLAGPGVGCTDFWGGALDSMDPAKSSEAHPACKPDVMVNNGALQLALNSLRRGPSSQNEIAQELAKTVKPIVAASMVDAHEVKHCTTPTKVKTNIVLADMIGPIDGARKLQLDQYHARLIKAASTDPLEIARNGEIYAKCTVELMTLLGKDAHCAQVDCQLWDEYSDFMKEKTGMRPHEHVTRALVALWMQSPQPA